MTATYPARTGKAYRGVIYGLDVVDHVTGEIVHDDYVGQTRQRGKLRELQHRDRQPFSDRIVGDAHVLWEGVCTDEELDEMERRFIQDVERQPRLNVELNENNWHRIPKNVQIAQRHERDARLKRTPWVPYEQRTRYSLLEWDTPERPAYDRAIPVRQKPSAAGPGRWSRAEKRAIGWGSTWLVLWITGWVLAAVRTVGHHPCRDSAIAATALLGLTAVWLWLGRPVRPRTWKRRIRRKLPGWVR